ncbi:MAG TPA: ABC transporter substrate-binding protein [Anaerolineales bacterium]
MPSLPGWRRALLFSAICIALLTGCTLPWQRVAAPTPEVVATVPSAPTPETSRSLTICLGEEPNTLYPLGSLNSAARSVLAAIDDGPIDTLSYDYQPVILTKLPSLADGDAQIVSADVQSGDTVVDIDGNVVLLAAGVKVRPSGCRADDCILTYDGASALKLDQMIVTFHLRSDVTWSDGTPLTADDSVYGYQIAAETAELGSRFVLDRTQVYEAVDPTSTQWWGIPGFLDQSFMINFWLPAPKHAWSQFKASELSQIDVASRSPLGWGPYRIEEWLAGDHIRLSKNPSYFRSAEGFPKFDQVTFRFISDPNAAISELTADHCDILDPSVRLDGQMALLSQLEQSGEARGSVAPGMTIEWLGLGIVPATYDDGLNLARNDRPDMLADARTRQALALCLDRQKAVDTVLFGRSSVPQSFVPADHPLYNGTVPGYQHDTAAGIQLLEQVGWKDTDGNPATPRIASAVKDVPAGTQLTLNYYSTAALQRRQVADILSASLQACGVGVNVQYFSQDDLYASGPEGLLFGRRFDLIEYAMSTDDVQPPCDWFTSSQVPNAGNHWIGTNVTGFKDPEYDAACHAAALALPGEPGYAQAYSQAQTIFASQLPAIPLYYRLKVAAARSDVCHFDLDPSANPMWNLEAFDMGQGCQ